jgi:hypothetical protein
MACLCPLLIAYDLNLAVTDFVNDNWLSLGSEYDLQLALFADILRRRLSIGFGQQTKQLTALMTVIRDVKTGREDFVFFSDRIIRLLVEEALNHVSFVEKTVQTPTGSDFTGLGFTGRICGVSIMRAGESMEAGLRHCCRSVRIGKILIQRGVHSSGCYCD